ncbi:MAG: efflux RND transporter periplasmic adaptor subunit [Planctomycetota bacterium]
MPPPASARPPRGPFRRRALLLAPVLLLAACSQSRADEVDQPVEEAPLVRAVPAELRMVQREIRTTGFLESEHQAQVVSLISGRLLGLHGDVGVEVEKGQLLAEIDDREARSAIEQLVVQRDSKQVDKDLAELEVEAAQRRIAQASFEAQKARAEFDRQAQTDPDYVSPKALQDSELLWQAADAAHKVAEFNARKAELEVTRIGSTIAELQARIDELEVRLEHHRIVAPFAGVLTARHVVEGSTLSAGAVLFDLVDPDHLVAYLDRPQGELDLVRKSRIVTFTTDALPDREFTADVDLVGPMVDRATGHFRLRVRVRPADARTLLHGMFVRAVIRAEELREALMVPKTAVLSEGAVSVVMTVRDDKACRIDLDPGLEQGDLVECRNRGDGGMQPGDLVITEGHEDLEDQAAVRVAQ